MDPASLVLHTESETGDPGLYLELDPGPWTLDPAPWTLGPGPNTALDPRLYTLARRRLESVRLPLYLVIVHLCHIVDELSVARALRVGPTHTFPTSYIRGLHGEPHKQALCPQHAYRAV